MPEFPLSKIIYTVIPRRVIMNGGRRILEFAVITSFKNADDFRDYPGTVSAQDLEIQIWVVPTSSSGFRLSTITIGQIFKEEKVKKLWKHFFDSSLFSKKDIETSYFEQIKTSDIVEYKSKRSYNFLMEQIKAKLEGTYLKENFYNNTNLTTEMGRSLLVSSNILEGVKRNSETRTSQNDNIMSITPYDILKILRNYPQVLKELKLIIYGESDITDKYVGTLGTLKVIVKAEYSKYFTNYICEKDINPDTFSLRPRNVESIVECKKFDLKNGLVRLKDRFSLTQISDTSTLMKLKEMLRTNAEPSHLETNGLYLIDYSIKEEFNDETLNKEKYGLYLEDLIQGYRVDMKVEDVGGTWHSLNVRNSEIIIKTNPAIPIKGIEEGWLSDGALTRTNPNIVSNETFSVYMSDSPKYVSWNTDKEKVLPYYRNLDINPFVRIPFFQPTLFNDYLAKYEENIYATLFNRFKNDKDYPSVSEVAKLEDLDYTRIDTDNYPGYKKQYKFVINPSHFIMIDNDSKNRERFLFFKINYLFLFVKEADYVDKKIVYLVEINLMRPGKCNQEERSIDRSDLKLYFDSAEDIKNEDTHKNVRKILGHTFPFYNFFVVIDTKFLVKEDSNYDQVFDINNLTIIKQQGYKQPNCYSDEEDSKNIKIDSQGYFYYTKKYFPNKSICNIKGWHLSIPYPFIKDIEKSPGSGTNEEYLLKKMTVEHKVDASGKIPQMRFGKNYSVKLRYVTIDGYSSNSTISVPSKEYELNCDFRRLDPVGVPTMLIRKRIVKLSDDKKSIIEETGYEGETDTHLVIRDQGVECSRGIAPSGIPWQMAEWHGMYDKNGIIDAEKLKKVNDKLAKVCDDGTFIENEITRSMEGIITLDFNSFRGKFNRLEDTRKEVPYIFDPMAKYLEIICLSNEKYSLRIGKEINKIRFFQSEKGILPVDSSRAIEFTIKHGKQFNWEIDEPLNTIILSLPPGEDLTFAMRAFTDDPEIMSLNKFITLSKTKTLSEVSDYSFEVISNSLKFKTTYATQQPIIQMSDFKIFKTKVMRTWTKKERNSALIKFDLNFPGKTSDRLELLAILEEVDLKETMNLGKKVVTETPLTKVYDFKLEDEIAGQKEDMEGEFLELGEIMDTTNSKKEDGVSDERQQYLLHQDKRKDFHAFHFFNDGKYRKVKYKLRATSRFGKFFSKVNPNYVESGFYEVTVPSSTSPKPPNIAYFQVLWGYKKGVVGNPINKVIKERKGSAIRIYFNEWFTSGDDEKLAVLIHNQKSFPDIQIRNFISSCGKDMTTYGKSMEQMSFEFFDNADKIEKIEKITLDDPFFKIRREKYELYDQYINHNSPVSALLFDIKVDSKQKLFYSDIVFSNKFEESYFSFVRMALATYQKNSIKYEEASSSMLTDFFQLPLNRTLILERIQGNKINLALSGLKRQFKWLNQEELRSRVFVKFLNEKDFTDNVEDEIVYFSNSEIKWVELKPTEYYGTLFFRLDGITIEGKTKILIKEFEFFGISTEDVDPDDSEKFRLVYGEVIDIT